MKHLIFLAGLSLLSCLSATAVASDYRDLVAPDVRRYELNGPVRQVVERTSKLGITGKPVLFTERTLRFDRAGYLLEDIDNNLRTESKTVETYIYEEAGDLLRVDAIKDKELPRIMVVEVEAGQHIMRMLLQRPKEADLKLRELVFDSSRLEKEVRDFDAKGRIGSSLAYLRNADGREIERTLVDEKGKVRMSSATSRDERGFKRVIVLKTLPDRVADRRTTTMEHELGAWDAHGNWTKGTVKTKTAGPSGTFVANPDLVERVFDYYE